MILSRKWANDYVDLTDIDNKTFCDEMTLSGSKVEGYEVEGSDIENVVVGQVLSMEKHPDSDHLWVCQVSVGDDQPLQIVTGAQNLKPMDIVPVALVGATVINRKDHKLEKIKKGKLRGVASAGMLCSFDELGLTQNDFPYACADGIFVLGDDCDKTLGMDIHKAIGYDDTCVEFEITSNRCDCLSVTGLAREAAATFDRPFTLPEPEVKPGHGNVNDLLQVHIEDGEKCYRYTGAVVENVRVKESPRWLRERLRACGVRPISNIVDITNYVMLEYGQPMHAFDLRYLVGNTVNVRNAKAGETITTLDGETRELTENMLVIADTEKPVAVAGVMGGEYSGIMDDTTTIVFESACFNGTCVRRTAKALGMRTEASARYEKELDPNQTMRALKRALQLVQLLDAGDVVDGVVDCCKKVKEQVTVDWDYQWINRFIGFDLSEQQMIDILKKIDFDVRDGKVYAPTFRNDIEHLADLAEEVARFYGFHNIPNHMLQGAANGKLTHRQSFERKLGNTLLACGCTEVSTFSFISPKAYDKICLPPDSELRNSIVILNPLGEDTSIMRTTILPSMLDVLSFNYNHKTEAACMYEMGTVYTPTTPDKLPIESQKVTIGMYGNGADFFALKGIVEKLLDCLHVDHYDVEPVKDNPTFHPGRTAAFTMDGKVVLATLGEVHPTVAENYAIGTRVYLAELDVNTAYENESGTRTHKPLPKYPASNRDLAFVCDKEIPVLKLQRAIGEAVGKTLESVKLFDVYQGEQIEKGKKSVAFNIRMRAHDRTLTDDEADAAMKRVVKALDKMGISLRS